MRLVLSKYAQHCSPKLLGSMEGFDEGDEGEQSGDEETAGAEDDSGDYGSDSGD